MVESTSSSLTERRARFVYEAARLAAIAAEAKVIPAEWDFREEPFKTQFRAVIERQCAPGALQSPKEVHDDWMRAYRDMGWTFGRVYDPVAKKHPDLVPYEQLDPVAKDKDEIFIILCNIAFRFIRESANAGEKMRELVERNQRLLRVNTRLKNLVEYVIGQLKAAGIGSGFNETECSALIDYLQSSFVVLSETSAVDA